MAIAFPFQFPRRRALFLFVLVISSLWLYYSQVSDKKTTQIDNRPDYKLNDVHFINTNKKGKVINRMDAKKIIKQQNDSFVVVENPVVSSNSNSGSTWVTRAVSARMPESLEHINLLGETTISGEISGRAIEILSYDVTVLSRSNRAETNKDCTIVSPGSRLTGTGMQLDYKTNTLELKHNVKGLFELNSRSD